MVGIRPVAEADRPGVAAVAASVLSSFDASPSVSRWGAAMRQGFVDRWMPAAGGGGNHRMVVAVEGRDVVGAASGLRGERSQRSFVRIGVRPEHRGRRIGRALLDALHDEMPGSYFVRETLSDTGSIAFFRRNGFITGELALEGRLDLARAAASEWIDEFAAAEIDDVSVSSAYDAGARDDAIAALVDDHDPVDCASERHYGERRHARR